MARTKAEKMTEETKTAAETVEETVQKVYIGPSIPRSRLRNAMILKGTEKEIEAFLKDYSERYPEIKYLLITPDKLAEAQAKVKTKGNILNKYYLDMAAKAASSRRGAKTYG